MEVYCGTSIPIVYAIKGVAVTEPETNCTFGGKLTGGMFVGLSGSIMNPWPVYGAVYFDNDAS